MNTDDPRVQAGLHAQAGARRAALDAGARRLGWKAGLGTAAAKERVRLSAPVVGFLTDATLVPSGDVVDVAGWANPMLEAEIAIRVGADVAAGARREEALAAVAAIAPAIELVDLGAPDDIEAVLAGNVFHRAVVLGDFVPCAGGDGLDAARLDIRGDGEPVSGLDPRELLGDLVDVVRALADQLPLADDGLRAGDVVITGAGAPPSPLAPGARWTVALAGGPEASVQIR